MKKGFSILLVVILMVGVAGCGQASAAPTAVQPSAISSNVSDVAISTTESSSSETVLAFDEADFENFISQSLFYSFLSENISSPSLNTNDKMMKIWQIVSVYLENRDRANGTAVNKNENDIAYYPLSTFENTTNQMFGFSIDYQSYATQDAFKGPEEGTLCVAQGYSMGYIEGSTVDGSIKLEGDTFTVEVQLQWVEPDGSIVDKGVKLYRFQYFPNNTECKYQFVSISDA